MNPFLVFGSAQAALADHYQRQLEGARALYASIGELVREPSLPEDVRRQTVERQKAAAVQIAELLKEWEKFGGTIELASSLQPLMSLLESPQTFRPVLVPEPAVPKPEPVAATPAPATPPSSARSVVIKRVEVSPPETPQKIVVTGNVWKVACSERVSRLREPSLERCVETVHDWPFLDSLPEDVCQNVLEYVVAYARSVPDKNAQLNVIFGVARYIRRHRILTFVYGLAKSHAKKSRATNWADRMTRALASLEDALTDGSPAKVPNRERLLKELETVLAEKGTTPKDITDLVGLILNSGVAANHTRLVNLLAPHLEILVGNSLKGVRKAVRKMLEEEAAKDAEAEPKVGIVADDWPWLDRTMGRKAVLFGGTPVPGHADRVREAFYFESVEWEEAEHTSRAFDTAIERILSGRYDFVLVLVRFTSHRAELLLDAAKRMNVVAVRVHHGYGLTRLKHAIETTLPTPPPSAA